MESVTLVVKEDVVELQCKGGVLSTKRQKDKLYTPEQIAEYSGRNVSLVKHLLNTAGAINSDGKVEGHWLAMIHHITDRENLENWLPTTPRDRAYKYMRQLSQLRHCSDGNALYGDYRVHEFFADLVDLVDFFLSSQSLNRVKHSSDEIYAAMNAKGKELYDVTLEDYKPYNWSSLEGNIESDEAITFYNKLKLFRVFAQGREALMENTQRAISDMVIEDFPENSVQFLPIKHTYGVLMVEIAGPNPGKVARELREMTTCRMVNAPGDDADSSLKYYLIF